ncbi:MAG: hypothetical protein FJZ47_10820 [Candidatus Tectomicrobia bacterium]|uniref:AB hydrolase-1 domain-containing protein n=1 Tax=Tectimicrobiota bacterium TaxID=2528274 RepID=A0A937VZY2_UNCTE|nr:hypothetical protein [Candidatus Tectomicrobia bacterium]
MTTATAFGGMCLFDAARAAGSTCTVEVLPEDKFVQANGMRLHYLDWDNSTKPKMLLLHGGAQSAHSWDFFALAMWEHFHIVALDQRSHGDSAWSEAGDSVLALGRRGMRIVSGFLVGDDYAGYTLCCHGGEVSRGWQGNPPGYGRERLRVFFGRSRTLNSKI